MQRYQMSSCDSMFEHCSQAVLFFLLVRLSGFHGNCMALTPTCLSRLLQVVLGQKVVRPCVFDQQLVQSILDCQNDNSFLTRLGGTMCTDDFYEGVCMCVYSTFQLCCHSYLYICGVDR